MIISIKSNLLRANRRDETNEHTKKNDVFRRFGKNCTVFSIYTRFTVISTVPNGIEWNVTERIK